MKINKIVKYAVIAVFAIMLVWSSVFVVDAGYRGVKSTLGTVEEHSYLNGIGVKAPFITKVISFDVRTKK